MPDVSHKPHPTTMGPLWKNFSFTLMWTSTAASGFGDRMIMFATLVLLGGVALGVESTSIMAGTQFWFFLPYIFFSVPGGWIADRLPRKWVLFTCDEARGLILIYAYFELARASGHSTIAPEYHWQVYMVLFAIGTFAAIFNPTRGAIVPQLVGKEQLQPANALVIVINVVFSLIGAFVAVRIIDTEDAGTVRIGIILGACFYLISGTFFTMMKPRDARRVEEGRTPRQAVSFQEGLHYARKHRKVVSLIGAHVLVWSVAAALYSGIIGIVKVNFGLIDEELLKHTGDIGVAMGAGMLLGAVAIGVIRTRRESTTVCCGAIMFAGLNVLLISLVPVLPVTYIAAFFIGIGGNIAIVSIISILQTAVPNHVRGSIMGINGMVTTACCVGVYFCLWKLPQADTFIVHALRVVGPLMILGGLFVLLKYLRSGPMPTPLANGLRHLIRLFLLVWHRMQWTGMQHLPADGPVILAPNHTTALDPFLIQAASPRLVRWLMLSSYRFKLLTPLWNASKPICLDQVPGKEKAEPGIKQVRQIVKELKQGDVVGIFPEGHLQYDDRVLKPFEEGVAVIAKLSKAKVVPCWIEGTPLSRKMWVHFLKPTRSKITFGQAFEYGDGDTPESFTAELRERIEGLAAEKVNSE